MFFPHTYLLYTLLGRILFTVLFVMIFYKCNTFIKLIKHTLVFFIVSLLFSGFVYFIAYQISIKDTSIISNGVPYLDLNITTLISLVIAAYLIILAFIKICSRNLSRNKIIQSAKLILMNKKYKLNILMDTGCELIEPLSGKPVILIGGEKNSYTFLENEHIKYRLVKISTVSKNNDNLIPVFEPEHITTKYGKYYFDKKNCYVGFVNTEFCSDGLYNAIASPDAFTEKNNKYIFRGKNNVPKTKKVLKTALSKLCFKKGWQSFLRRRKRHSASSAE